MELIFRELEPTDASAYQALRMQALQEEPQAFTRSYDDECTLSNRDFEAHITATHNRFTIGVLDGNNLVACVHFCRSRQSQRRHLGEISELYVEPSYRSEDIGKDLISDCIDRAGELPYLTHIDAICSAASIHARRLFKGAGFAVWGIESNAIRVKDEPVTQLHMRRPLEPETEAKKAVETQSAKTQTSADTGTYAEYAKPKAAAGKDTSKRITVAAKPG